MSNFYTSNTATLETMAVYIVLALSVQVALRSGVFSFASIGFFGVGGYIAADLAQRGTSVLLELVTVLVVSGAAGYLLAIPLVRLRGLYLGMVTFAFDAIVQIVATNGGSLTGGADGKYGYELQVSAWLLLLMAVACIALVSQLERRKLGRAALAISANERLANALGVNVTREYRNVFALSAALGGLAGMMNALAFVTMTPDSFNFNLAIVAVTMAVVGGVGSWTGALVGAIIVAWFPIVFAGLGKYQLAVYGVVLVLVVVFQPRGVVGIAQTIGRSAKAALWTNRRTSANAVQVSNMSRPDVKL